MRKKYARRLALEALEPRQLLATVPGTESSLDRFVNYYPPTRVHYGTEDFLSAPASGDPLTVGINYLKQNGVSFGLTDADLTTGRYSVSGRYSDTDTNITHIYLQQVYNGLPVADAVGGVHLMPNGQIIAASTNFVPGLGNGSGTPSPGMDAAEAVNVFATAAGLTYDGTLDVVSPPTGLSQKTTFVDPDLSRDPISAQLQYVPAPGGGVELAWQIIVRTPDGQHWYDLAVGAEGNRAGEIVRVADWVDKATAPNATYNVFLGSVQDPLFGTRTLVTNPHSPLASPYGWHDINGVFGADYPDTRGNNVFAQEDRDANDTAGVRPNGGPSLVFDYPIDFTQQPTTYENASITNLFYWVNIAHDVAYHHGFTEAAGNFQFKNYTNKGLGGDPVLADAQDAAAPAFPLPPIPAFNNAFMATPPDGISPRMGMFLFNLTNPFRDGSLDSTIITHEFAHGITNRLTGGPANANALNALQSGGMGEGWSDWFAMLLTSKPTDNRNTPRTTGNWVLGQTINGGGVRRFPYSFDMSINPLTFDRYNGDFFPQQNNSEVHNAGEIWASMLWDLTWLLIERYGYNNNLYGGNGGQSAALKLIFQGLKIQPANPSFIEARNALFAADLALNGGRNFDLIWQAFSRRGMGLSANAGLNANSLSVFEVFDMPQPRFQIGGTAFEDADGDGTRDPNEQPLAGWTIYIDANNNGILEDGEARTTTAADGTYSFPFYRNNVTVNIREVVMPGWRLAAPTSGVRTVTANSGQFLTNVNFANQPLPGEIRGVVWNDLNADTTRTPDEPGLAGVWVYVDLNNNGVMNALEPAGVSDSLGNFRIMNVRPGTYPVRQVVPSGQAQVFPDPAGGTGGAIGSVVVGPGQVIWLPTGTGGGVFGNSVTLDFGDAPDSYGTLLASNGPRHGVVPSLRLGNTIDGEPNGFPSADALGDGTDEDGVQFVSAVTPGGPATLRVTVNTGTAPAAKLHGWIDFNRNGTFEASERIIANRILGTGVHTLTFTVPSSASLGPTYARFRYGYEADLGPTGPAVAGEVEDYTVSVLANIPVANNDVFPRPGDPPIKLGNFSYELDVLANDTGTTLNPVPFILPGSFPSVLPTGATLELSPTFDRIIYRPGPGSIIGENFTYQVTDGATISNVASVRINVAPGDPRAVDDFVQILIPPAPAPQPPLSIQIAPLLNDVPSVLPNTLQIIGTPVKLSGNVVGDTLTVNADRKTLTFTRPSASFRGTIVYEYTINEVPDDPQTSPGVGRITIQIVDSDATGTPLPVPPGQPNGHLAQLIVDVLNPATGQPISTLTVGEQFLVRVSAQDLRPGGNNNNRGVEAAYLDLLFDPAFVAPVVVPGNPPGLSITFAPNYDNATSGRPNTPGPGSIDEVGGAHVSLANPYAPVGTGLKTVLTFLMEARGATAPGQPIQIFGDPAEFLATGSDPILHDVVLAPENPNDIDVQFVTLTDEQVFLRPSLPLTIVNVGQGEFTNLANPLDVNRDRTVSPLDALLVINELNSTGARPISPLDYLSATEAARRYVDVNMDSYIAPIDALLVFNYLNGRSNASGEGEGSLLEGSVAAAGEGSTAPASDMLGGAWSAALSSDDKLPAASSLTSSTSPAAAAPTSPTSAVAADSVLPILVKPSPLASSIEASKKVDEDAADELFALLFAEEAE